MSTLHESRLELGGNGQGQTPIVVSETIERRATREELEGALKLRRSPAGSVAATAGAMCIAANDKIFTKDIEYDLDNRFFEARECV